MKNNSSVNIAWVLGLTLACSGAALADPPQTPSPKAAGAIQKPGAKHMHTTTSAASGASQMYKIMSDSQKMSVPKADSADKEFATLMTMHHQTAIKMAEAELQSGTSAELKALASKMKMAQQEEIKQMAPYTK